MEPGFDETHTTSPSGVQSHENFDQVVDNTSMDELQVGFGGESVQVNETCPVKMIKEADPTCPDVNTTTANVANDHLSDGELPVIVNTNHSKSTVDEIVNKSNLSKEESIDAENAEVTGDVVGTMCDIPESNSDCQDVAVEDPTNNSNAPKQSPENNSHSPSYRQDYNFEVNSGPVCVSYSHNQANISEDGSVIQIYHEPPPAYPQTGYQQVTPDQKSTNQVPVTVTPGNIPTVVMPDQRPGTEPYRSNSVKSESSDLAAQGQQQPTSSWNYYPSTSETGSEYPPYSQYSDFDRQYSVPQGYPEHVARGPSDPMLPGPSDADDIAAFQAHQQYLANCANATYTGLQKQEDGQIGQGQYKGQVIMEQGANQDTTMTTVPHRPIKKQKKVVVPAGKKILLYLTEYVFVNVQCIKFFYLSDHMT